MTPQYFFFVVDSLQSKSPLIAASLVKQQLKKLAWIQGLCLIKEKKKKKTFKSTRFTPTWCDTHTIRGTWKMKTNEKG